MNYSRTFLALGLALSLGRSQAAAADSASCAFVAATETRVGNGSEIGGDLGANDPGGKVRLGRKVVLADDTTVAGDDVGVSNGSSLFDVAANRFGSGRHVVVRGTVSTPSLPLADPFCPLPDLTCGGPDVVVRRGDPPRALSPGSYGDIVLENGARLELAPGVYDACSLSAGRGVDISVTGALPSTLNIVGDLRLENGSVLGPDAGVPTPTLNVGGDQVRLGAKVELESFVAAPNADVRIRHGSSVTGSLCARELSTGHSVTFACSPNLPPTTTTTTSTTPTTSTSSSTSSTSTTTSSTSTAPTTSTSTSSSSTVPTSTTTTTAPTTTTTTTTEPTTTSTTTTSSTTTTTQPTMVTCGPGGIVAHIVVPYDTRTLPALASLRLDVGYPPTV